VSCLLWGARFLTCSFCSLGQGDANTKKTKKKRKKKRKASAKPNVRLSRGVGPQKVAGWGGGDDEDGSKSKGGHKTWASREAGEVEFFLNAEGVAFLRRWVNAANDLLDVMRLFDIWWGPTGGGNIRVVWQALLSSLAYLFKNDDLPRGRFLDREGGLEFCVDSESCILTGASREGLLGSLRAFFLQFGPDWRDERMELFEVLAQDENKGDSLRCCAFLPTHCLSFTAFVGDLAAQLATAPSNLLAQQISTLMLSLLKARCVEAHTGDGWCGVTNGDLIRALGLGGLSSEVVPDIDDDDDERGQEAEAEAEVCFLCVCQ
jgi:hypothetical protein